MARVWHKVIPPKKAQEEFNIYTGTWMPQLDRAWESEDGYSVMSRKIMSEWGPVEHVTIQNLVGKGDVPWAVKQEIKDRLFGNRCTAIEVFPKKKNLVDVCDVYHLWILPENFKLPFGIHPIRDTQCPSIERGYDFDINECVAWNESDTRKELMSKRELSPEQLQRVSELEDMIDGRKNEIHTLRSQ